MGSRGAARGFMARCAGRRRLAWFSAPPEARLGEGAALGPPCAVAPLRLPTSVCFIRNKHLLLPFWGPSSPWIPSCHSLLPWSSFSTGARDASSSFPGGSHLLLASRRPTGKYHWPPPCSFRLDIRPPPPLTCNGRAMASNGLAQYTRPSANTIVAPAVGAIARLKPCNIALRYVLSCDAM